MFKWYENARVCYAYLSDVDSQTGISKQFWTSAWFRRGWTLQELLAPQTVVFFNRNWMDIGTKSSLEDVIKTVTRIRDLFAWHECCIAEKMSWASRRNTSRIEDEAYCLMGLFDVSMPLLYGEGRKAFQRLQLEILKSTDDDSLYCWYSRVNKVGDMLAPSPAAFQISSGIRYQSQKDSISSVADLYLNPRGYFYRKAYPTTSSNKGLHISLFLIPLLALDLDIQVERRDNVFVALFQGLESGTRDHSPAILLKKYVSEAVGYSIHRQDWTCARILSDRMFSLDLQETGCQCEEWIKAQQRSVDAETLATRKLDDHLYPKSRIVYVKSDPSDSWEPNIRASYDIILDASSLQANSFAMIPPTPLYPKGDELSSNVSAWKPNNSPLPIHRPLRIKFREATHRGPCYFHVYFTNHSTKETLLFLMSVNILGRATLLLLKLDTDQTFRNAAVPSLLEQTPLWDAQAAGTDRVSIRLNNGSTISATIRRAGAPLGTTEYIANMILDESGNTFWQPTVRHQELTDFLACRLERRDEDPEALQEYCRAQRYSLNDELLMSILNIA